MTTQSWIRNLFTRPATRPIRQVSHRARLAVEALEGRTVPSTFTVLNLLDSGAGSLRAAIASANSNPGADDIRFAPSARDGTIALTTGQLSITDDLTIDGPGQNRLTLSGNNASRVFRISGATTDVAISGLTIANGRATDVVAVGFFGPTTLGGGILNDGAGLSLSHVTVANNRADGGADLQGFGGGIANLDGARFTATHSTFRGNVASSDLSAASGALYNEHGSTAVIGHSTFAGNRALGGFAFGGAIGNYDGSELTVAHSTFANNEARGLEGYGGAIEMESFGLFPGVPATATIAHSSFTGNRAVGGHGSNGGAGEDGEFGGIAVGGAIAHFESNLTISHSRFTDNEARGGNGGNGGAGGSGGDAGLGLGGAIGTTVFIDSTLLNLTVVSHSQFIGNRAVGGNGGAGGSGGNGGLGGRADGGAVVSFVGTLDVSHSRVVDNEARAGAGGDRGSGAGTVGGDGGLARAGGIANELGGTATLSHVSIVNNRATGGAGGLGGNGGTAFGGGLFNGRPDATGATLTIANSHVRGNEARGGAGGAGGNGGDGLGGGLFNGNPTPGTAPVVTMTRTDVTDNAALRGAAGAGGTAGQGVGGGVYNLGTFFVDVIRAIRGNRASTSNDDVFGTLTPL